MFAKNDYYEQVIADHEASKSTYVSLICFCVVFSVKGAVFLFVLKLLALAKCSPKNGNALCCGLK